MGSQRVAHDSVTKQQQMCYIKKNLTRKEKKQSKTNPTMHIQLWHNHTENQQRATKKHTEKILYYIQQNYC